MDIIFCLSYVPEITTTPPNIYCHKHAPTITIIKYAERICKYLSINSEILSFAIYYMALYVMKTKILVCTFNVHRLFLIAAAVSHKFWDDNCYKNKHIARVGGVSCAELNGLERNFLATIDYQIFAIQSKFTPGEFTEIIEFVTGTPQYEMQGAYADLQDAAKVVHISMFNDVLEGIKNFSFHNNVSKSSAHRIVRIHYTR